MYGQRYLCDHPVYHSCTLFLIEEKGLAVIQQRYDPEAKATFWTEVDAWLTDALYLHPKFKEFFDKEVPSNPLKAEYLIPVFIGELLNQGKMSVKVLKTNDTWYGMTLSRRCRICERQLQEDAGEWCVQS